MKTPLEELIEEYQELRENGDNDMRTVIYLAKQMLQKEKEVIETVFDDGCYDGQLEISKKERKFNSSEDYYNQTFKK